MSPSFRASLLALAVAAACSTPTESNDVRLKYDEATGKLTVVLPRALGGSETLHAQVRRGGVGHLACAAQASDIPRIDGEKNELGFVGPTIDRAAFESPYDKTWLTGTPTQAMLDQIAEGGHILDICWMNGSTIVRQIEVDARVALDEAGSDGKFDGESEGEQIRSTAAYADACVAELGDIPFFPRLADDDYGTYNCLDSEPIPTTVTDEAGHVTKPTETVQQCDNPQYIYSLCEPNAVSGQTNGPRVTRQENDKGTSWVLLCRKAKEEEGAYNDIAMIGHNPFTGRTCYFQNALYRQTDGLHVPHPGDRVQSEASPQQSESLWEGIHGGLGSGIECASCHDADPFIHTPWIDQARASDGAAMVPKMGEHDNFALGYNDAPYTILNSGGQGWSMPQQNTSPEVAACTRCHRMGDNKWSREWLTRLNGTDSAWTDITTPAYRKFEHVFWMPPDADGLDATSFPASDYGKAMAKLLACGDSPTGCSFEPLPSQPILDQGEEAEIDLDGIELARAGLVTLGAKINDTSCPGGDCSTRRCTECHSVSRVGLRRWADLTRTARETCKLGTDPDTMSETEARAAVDCMRIDPADGSSVFEAAKLGIYTTGVQYGHFQELFRKAYGEATWLIEYSKFKARVGMPKGNHPRFTQREHAILVKWFAADLGRLDDALPEAPPPATCTPERNATVLDAHLSDMKLDGWAAVNAEAGLHMYGCTGDDPLACLASTPDRTGTWGVAESGKIRELRKFAFRTSYWTRSSADGRFVGNGGGNTLGATITDMDKNKDIGVQASYDPGFFPDNTGFVFQGGTGGMGICRQSLLDNASKVDFTEPECIRASGINLYQHVARGLGGSGDYFIINSQFTSDPGSAATSDPSAPFNASSTMKLTPMVWSGSVYKQEEAVIVESPYEGDSVLSPSMRLVASRLAGPGGKTLGYVVRKVDAIRSGARYSIDIDQKVATVCVSGAKVNFSYDERFMVTHHYDGDKTNIVLIDLKDGSQRTITNMPANSRALFPHFRSDGWIYFLVKSPDGEYLAASDAAIRAAK
jgi:hypothetical protein